MKSHEQRVVVEADQLSDRVGKLSIFIDGSSSEYLQLPLMEKERLHLQRYLMRKYQNVLADRIAYFKE